METLPETTSRSAGRVEGMDQRWHLAIVLDCRLPYREIMRKDQSATVLQIGCVVQETSETTKPSVSAPVNSSTSLTSELPSGYRQSGMSDM